MSTPTQKNNTFKQRTDESFGKYLRRLVSMYNHNDKARKEEVLQTTNDPNYFLPVLETRLGKKLKREMEYEANRGNTSLQIWHWLAWDDDSVVKLRPLMRHAKHLHLDPEVALLRHPEIVPSKEGRYFAFATELAILLGVSATQDNFDICLTWESDNGVQTKCHFSLWYDYANTYRGDYQDTSR